MITFIYYFLTFSAGFLLGVLATALAVMAGDKTRRGEEREPKDKKFLKIVETPTKYCPRVDVPCVKEDWRALSKKSCYAAKVEKRELTYEELEEARHAILEKQKICKCEDCGYMSSDDMYQMYKYIYEEKQEV